MESLGKVLDWGLQTLGFSLWGLVFLGLGLGSDVWFRAQGLSCKVETWSPGVDSTQPTTIDPHWIFTKQRSLLSILGIVIKGTV